MAHDELLTATEVAERLAVSVRSVRRYAISGQLPPVHLGRAVRYHVGDVERLLAAGVPPPGEVTGAATSGLSGQAEQTGADRADSHERPPVDPSGLELSRAALTILDRELADLRAENTALYREVNALHREVIEKAEAAGLWQGRARTLEAQLLQLTAGQESPQTPVEPAPDAPGASKGPHTTDGSRSLWQRLLAAVRGEGLYNP